MHHIQTDMLMYKLFFGQLSDQQTELLTHIHTRVQGMVSVRLFEADTHHALIGMMTTLPKLLLSLLKKNTATRVHQLDLKYHCQLEMQF